MFSEALATPTRGDRAVARVAVGTALVVATPGALALWALAIVETTAAAALAPVALAPALLLRGYWVRTVAAGVRREPAAPSFEKPLSLYRDGIASWLLTLVYLLPLAILVALGGGTASAVWLDRVTLGVARTEAVAAIGGVTGVAGLVWTAAYLYLRPAAEASFAESGRLRDGVSLPRVRRVATDGDYVAGWALSLVVLGVGLVLVTPFLALLVGAVLLFLVRVAAASLIGRGAARALTPRTTTPVAGEGDSDSDEGADTDTGPIERADIDAAVIGRSEPYAEPEADADVQVGRRVPLTASDIISPSRVGGPGGDAETDDGSDAEGEDASEPTDTRPGDAGRATGGFRWEASPEEEKG